MNGTSVKSKTFKLNQWSRGVHFLNISMIHKLSLYEAVRQSSMFTPKINSLGIVGVTYSSQKHTGRTILKSRDFLCIHPPFKYPKQGYFIQKQGVYIW